MLTNHLPDLHHHCALLYLLPLLLKVQQKGRLGQERQVHFLPARTGYLCCLSELFVDDDAPTKVAGHFHGIAEGVHLAKALQSDLHFLLVIVFPKGGLAIGAEIHFGRIPRLSVLIL